MSTSTPSPHVPLRGTAETASTCSSPPRHGSQGDRITPASGHVVHVGALESTARRRRSSTAPVGSSSRPSSCWERERKGKVSADDVRPMILDLRPAPTGDRMVADLVTVGRALRPAELAALAYPDTNPLDVRALRYSSISGPRRTSGARCCRFRPTWTCASTGGARMRRDIHHGRQQHRRPVGRPGRNARLR